MGQGHCAASICRPTAVSADGRGGALHLEHEAPMPETFRPEPRRLGDSLSFEDASLVAHPATPAAAAVAAAAAAAGEAREAAKFAPGLAWRSVDAHDRGRRTMAGFSTGPVINMRASPICGIGLMDGLVKSPLTDGSTAAASSSSCSSPAGDKSSIATLPRSGTPESTKPSSSRATEAGTPGSDVEVFSLSTVQDSEQNGSVAQEAHEQLKRFTEAQLEELRKVYAQFEQTLPDGERAILTKDLGAVTTSLGQKRTEEELQALVLKVDGDGSGALDFDEFLIFASALGIAKPALSEEAADSDSCLPLLGTTEQEEDLRSFFGLFAKGGKGTLLTRDLGKAMRALGQDISEEELEQMIAEADEDRSGALDFAEFLQLVMQLKSFTVPCLDHVENVTAKDARH